MGMLPVYSIVFLAVMESMSVVSMTVCMIPQDKRNVDMRILVDKNVIEFMPETPQENKELEVMWRIVVDCYGDNKKIVPMGNFVPGHDKVARFHIEGI